MAAPVANGRRCEVEGCRAPPSGRFCERHWKQVQRAGLPAETAYARMMDTVFALGAIDTDVDGDGEFEAAKRRFDRAFLEAARHHAFVLSKVTRRMRRR